MKLWFAVTVFSAAFVTGYFIPIVDGLYGISIGHARGTPLQNPLHKSGKNSIRSTPEPSSPPPGFAVDTLAAGLTVPWEIVFMPDGTMLFTERNGKVRIYRNNRLLEKCALRLTEVDTTKKMGLLGLCLHPGFAQKEYCYIAYNVRNEGKPQLKIVRYTFRNDSLLQPLPVLDGIRASPNHTGCRLLFGPGAKLYITTGDADRPIDAQDLKSLNGKILRVADDGSVPPDNPFVANDTARKEIWSYGHRNTQGLAFMPGTDDLYNSEHGPTGGGKVNRIIKGGNYGWPLVHHTDAREGTVSPLAEFTPSVGPSQIVFYNAAVFPSLNGSLLLACLRGEKLIRFAVKEQKVFAQEQFLEKQYGRLRALTVGPDGFLYLSTSQNDPPEGSPQPGYDMVLRLRPAGSVPAGSNITSVAAAQQTRSKPAAKKTPAVLYAQLCASCHGAKLEGTERAASMLDGKWLYGGTRRDILHSIRNGIIDKGMPAWDGSLPESDLQKLTDWVVRRTKPKR